MSIVSGLARGIDGIAHQACIDRQGKTIAILGSGLGSIYPSEHHRLAQQIEEHGLLLSEHVPFRKPNRQCFPQRNRIISGLCPILVVIEAPEEVGLSLQRGWPWNKPRSHGSAGSDLEQLIAGMPLIRDARTSSKRRRYS